MNFWEHWNYVGTKVRKKITYFNTTILWYCEWKKPIKTNALVNNYLAQKMSQYQKHVDN